MNAARPAPPSERAFGIAGVPPAAAPRAPDDGGSIALRVSAGIDVDALGDQLARLWRAVRGRPRAPARVELSVVETCGRTREARERDAMRLLRSESGACAPSGGLRATLVCVGARDHLLMLASAGGSLAAGELKALADELARLYPVAMLAGA